MRDPFRKPAAKGKPVHPYEWLWEPVENDPGFVLRPMFGGKSLYLDGKLKLDELITRRLKLEDINAGFDAMTRGELVRAVVELPA